MCAKARSGKASSRSSRTSTTSATTPSLIPIVDTRPPAEHVAVFDEAQRAWTLRMTENFMRRKKNIEGFSQSEPQFLISYLDRHRDWAVVVCLVGEGQEINTGEAGIDSGSTRSTRAFRTGAATGRCAGWQSLGRACA
ncbi:MAG: DNA/RNA helicase domain-containing protein [Acidobacteriota bacterium]